MASRNPAINKTNPRGRIVLAPIRRIVCFMNYTSQFDEINKGLKRSAIVLGRSITFSPTVRTNPLRDLTLKVCCRLMPNSGMPGPEALVYPPMGIVGPKVQIGDEQVFNEPLANGIEALTDGPVRPASTCSASVAGKS